MKFFNYIKLHWKGELPLPLAYLANFVGVAALLGLCLSLLVENLDWNAGLFHQGVIVYTLCFSLVIYVWGAVGALMTLLKINGKPILYIAYPIYVIGVIRFVRYFLQIFQFYFG
jgi:hypothetical protein